jgi:phospholipid transport system substrate-binding protein
MRQRPLLLSAFVLLACNIGGPPRSSAATNDPLNLVYDFGTRALAAMQSGDTAARESRFRQLYRLYFDEEACARSAIGLYWQTATAQQRREYVTRYEDYIVIVYSTLLSHISDESFTVLGSQPDQEGVVVRSQITGIAGTANISVDWQLHQTNNGYKVNNVVVSGVNMASMQNSDLVSVIQRNNGQLPALLVALRDKNASNGVFR